MLAQGAQSEENFHRPYVKNPKGKHLKKQTSTKHPGHQESKDYINVQSGALKSEDYEVNLQAKLSKYNQHKPRLTTFTAGTMSDVSTTVNG